MDDAIGFVESGEVTLDFLTQSALPMLFVQGTLVTSRWTCFLGLYQSLEMREDEEWCPCAIAESAKGVLTPLPRLVLHSSPPLDNNSDGDRILLAL